MRRDVGERAASLLGGTSAFQSTEWSRGGPWSSASFSLTLLLHLLLCCSSIQLLPACWLPRRTAVLAGLTTSLPSVLRSTSRKYFFAFGWGSIPNWFVLSVDSSFAECCVLNFILVLISLSQLIIAI